jgi:outer membrane protein assembly factor BamB
MIVFALRCRRLAGVRLQLEMNEVPMRLRTLLVTAGVAPVMLAGLMSAPADAASASTDWPTYGGGPAHTFVNNHETSLNQSTAHALLPDWEYDNGTAMEDSPAIVNGVAYYGDKGGGFVALRLVDRKVLWSFGLYAPITVSPTVADGKVFIIDGEFLYVVDQLTGKLLHGGYVGSDSSSAPTISGGQMFVGNEAGDVEAFDENSDVRRWAYRTGGIVYGSPTVSGGLVFASSADGYVYALNSTTGALKWKKKIGSTLYATPSVTGTSLFIGSSDHNIYALSTVTGAILWKTNIGDQIFGGTAASGLHVYAAQNAGIFWQLNAATGAREKSTWIGRSNSTPLICNGVAYIGTSISRLVAINAYSGGELWSYNTKSYITASPVIDHGSLYVGDMGSTFYSFTPRF